MSHANVEVAKTLVGATRPGDWKAALETYDPAVELDMSGSSPPV